MRGAFGWTVVRFVRADGRNAPASAPAPITSPPAPCHHMPSSAATGRGWAHPTFTCRRPAPGRRAGWLETQEARLRPFPAKCQ